MIQELLNLLSESIQKQLTDINNKNLDKLFIQRCLPSELYFGPDYYLQEAKKNNPKIKIVEFKDSDFGDTYYWMHKIAIKDRYPFDVIYIDKHHSELYDVYVHIGKERFEFIFKDFESMKNFILTEVFIILLFYKSLKLKGENDTRKQTSRV